MPSTRVVVESQGGAPRHRVSNSKGFIASTYQTLTSEENASVVRSVAFFGVSCADCHLFSVYQELILILTLLQVAVTFLASSWSELLVSVSSPLLARQRQLGQRANLQQTINNHPDVSVTPSSIS
ncbi:hypothetical protein B0T24DRAFT_205844 [Lasiosphaeria ovina]|uniref:Uncharacterized protein n=1 Tax=Lasiosphaeria ovina TaxID=92902 RepID=A0AAE0NA03_9PEZI|nr:hypothetical protein B0T24DRAFT_205844 [Lasiosphaeria ovina]